MDTDNLKKYRRSIMIAYICMFLALFTFLFSLFAYLFARKVALASDAEVWLQAQALWLMRSSIIYFICMIFAALWFVPLYFYYWDTYIWVTTCTVIGVVFTVVAFLYLLNAWIKGISKFVKNKAVY
ncbi:MULTISPECIES: hypothetical protein [unclassified Acinetobacter]|uniref:hypothetical protein n=1 Tax=unclassified Acinetobacter TaxID=196816 RepID=UPI0029351576|nr:MULTISPECIES: hypothetical protein [unclassified Acinetobacter]WOE30874.1 hypothetical protein QSG84_11020 [Acinetobacter sp. SAAs470]WOE39069.1 hypothetical protein QSG86_04685 [Acinetobacter sp. SAAs474]